MESEEPGGHGRDKGPRFHELSAGALFATLMLLLWPNGSEAMLNVTSAENGCILNAIVSALVGIAAGAGLYRVYQRVAARIEAELLRNAAWWGSVFGGGVLAFSVACLIQRLHVTGQGSVPLSHADVSAILGIVFGTGWGQGEKLM